ncbi:MAG: 50S ribosomal protein L31 [Campylobacteraceae bacterium 4484_166]|nr:MAG: 50S ribosomal protein L31 [Campylobacteraceae bacterium 4484_166]
MKKDIHPEFKTCEISCACGASWSSKSNVQTLKLDVCSSCHPFFTGERNVVDATGRIDKFKQKYNMK